MTLFLSLICSGLCGEADASELFLICLPPAHLQQTVHVPESHLRVSAGIRRLSAFESFLMADQNNKNETQNLLCFSRDEVQHLKDQNENVHV